MMARSFLIALVFALFCSSVFCKKTQWKTRPSLQIGRSDFSVNWLETTEEIAVAGGCVSDQFCRGAEFCYCQLVGDSMELWVPGTDSWKLGPSLPRPRYRHSSVVVGNKMYLIGGRNLQDEIIQEIDVFDVITRTWDTPFNWTTATSDLVAVPMGELIYMIGGYDQIYNSLKTVQIFNVTSGLLASGLQGAELNVGRGDACGTVVDGLIYVLGGFNDANFCQALNHFESYNPATNQWTVLPSSPNGRGDFACGVLHGNFHSIGGESKDHPTTCSKFSIPIRYIEGFSVKKTKWNEIGPLPFSRFRFAALTVRNTLYVLGGQGPVVNETYPLLNAVQSLFHSEPFKDDVETIALATVFGFIGAVILGILVVLLILWGLRRVQLRYYRRASEA